MRIASASLRTDDADSPAGEQVSIDEKNKPQKENCHSSVFVSLRSDKSVYAALSRDK